MAARMCPGCNQLRDEETDFYRKSGTGKPVRRCKECLRQEARNRRGPLTCPGCGEEFVHTSSVGARRKTCDRCAETGKWCTRCEAVKPYSDFHRYREKFYSYCKPCALAENRKRLYGWTEADAERFGHQCGICGDTEDLVVDHCHETGAIRGLLCGPCNKGLGMFRDDPNKLQAAIAYLARQFTTHQAGGD